MSEEAYLERLAALLSESERPRWAIARLLADAERNLGDVGSVWSLAGERGMTLATIRRRVWVANTWDDATVQTYPGLSFSHFEAVTARWLERQDAEDMLSQAEAGKLSVDELRAMVREMRQDGEEDELPYPDLEKPLSDYIAACFHSDDGIKAKRALRLAETAAAAARQWYIHRSWGPGGGA